VTADASLAAQFEHTLIITEGGAEVLTCWGLGRAEEARGGQRLVEAKVVGGNSQLVDHQ